MQEHSFKLASSSASFQQTSSEMHTRRKTNKMRGEMEDGVTIWLEHFGTVSTTMLSCGGNRSLKTSISGPTGHAISTRLPFRAASNAACTSISVFPDPGSPSMMSLLSISGSTALASSRVVPVGMWSRAVQFCSEMIHQISCETPVAKNRHDTALANGSPNCPAELQDPDPCHRQRSKLFCLIARAPTPEHAFIE